MVRGEINKHSRHVCACRYRSPAPKEKEKGFKTTLSVKTYITLAPRERGGINNNPKNVCTYRYRSPAPKERKKGFKTHFLYRRISPQLRWCRAKSRKTLKWIHRSTRKPSSKRKSERPAGQNQPKTGTDFEPKVVPVFGPKADSKTGY